MKHERNQTAYPLSPMQQGMLFHALGMAHTGGDIEQVLCSLPDSFDPDVLERAWQRVTEHHEILRTSFGWNGNGEPFQEIQSNISVPLHAKDWRSISETDEEQAFESWLTADRLNDFDLSRAPLMRVALFRTADTEWQLVWTFHHVLLDERGIVVVLNDVFTCYDALARGEEPALSHTPSFRDHIEYLQRLNDSKPEAFWRETLEGFNAPTPFPLPHPSERTSNESIRGCEEIQLSKETTEALNAFVAAHGLTLNTLVQAAWALLLARYSGTRDVVFGAVRHGRRSSIEGADSVAGLFINTVPMRVCVEPEAQLLPWLRDVRSRWVALRPFEHTALVDIQGWSCVPRDTPLFETLVNFQPRPAECSIRGNNRNEFRRRLHIRSQPNYPVTLDACGGDFLQLSVVYDRRRLDETTVTRMLGHLKTLLEAMIQHPESRLGELPLLTETERLQFAKWNETSAEYPKDKCIHELFEEQARRTPDALAITDNCRRISYAKLDQCAERLSEHLRSLGIGPDVRVGICLERSIELVAAELGVLKAGGAYVPLDPTNPRERLAFVLEDAKTPVLLTQQSLQARLKFDFQGVKVICVDGLLDAPLASVSNKINESAKPDQPRSHSRNLAYVIYTSGSTGTPKGVEIEHASVANLIAWHQRTYHVTPPDRATLLANPAFDASVWELWPYLTAGASVHIPDDETVHNPAKLVSWLGTREISLAFVPTPLAEALFDEVWPQRTFLRALFTGGDTLHRAPPENFPSPLFNHYGPTENTVVATSTKIEPSTSRVIPIGRPISNTRAFVLDDQLQPLPVGVPGELCIGGDGLARGYLNRPELNADKFVGSASRLYRTGDLARWLPDGNIEFLGRQDHQVKIRGHRIELGEIESLLASQPSVREVAVISFPKANGNELIAFVTAKPGMQINPNELQGFLKRRLPGYMLPAAFVVLGSLPLTANGKVDRKALITHSPNNPTPGEFVAPRSKTERTLIEIWREVLGIERIGVHDNFFELGGHSLLAARVISRATAVFNQNFTVRDLFDFPTIAALAERIQKPSEPAENNSKHLTSFEQNDHVPISFAQERLWFLEQLQPGIPVNNIPLAFQIEGLLDVAALEAALTQIIKRHDVFRTVFSSLNGQPQARLAPSQRFSIPVIDLSALPKTEMESKLNQLSQAEAMTPFDLDSSPHLRARLLRLGDTQHRLLLTTHHIAFDGWSADVLRQELGRFYSGAIHHEEIQAEEPSWNYGDFADWQRHTSQENPLEEHLAFWKRQLANAPSALDLPTDRPRPAVQTYRGAIIPIGLPAELSAELGKLGRSENVTLFMLLLAAFQTVLHRYSGQTDILVGTPTAGRTRIETEKLVGLFLNMLVLRGDLSGDPSFRELMQRVRKTALDAFEHQDIPFEKLADVIQPERDLSRSPLFQVMFVLQNEPQHPLELTGLNVTPVRVHSGTAKFDLTLSLEETANGISGYIEFNTDLFDESTISRLAGNFQTLLEGVVTNADQSISQLPLLTKNEKEQLARWNDTVADFPNSKTVHALFEEQVERTPDAVALAFEDEQLTYRESNERANRLAAELRALGVGPEMPVGICIERSLEMMIGLLAILKAGGCYLPLDPTYPSERLAFMLEDSQAAVLLTQERYKPAFASAVRGLQILCIESLSKRSASSGMIRNKCEMAARSDNLAYVIYTSGSTGKPKGVMLTHRNVVNFFTAMDRVLGVEPGVWLAVTSISFDISVLEIFWTLTRGYKVVIQPDEAYKSSPTNRGISQRHKMDFSLFYFASDAAVRDEDRYRLLIEGAKFADENGFKAVWTPERHFHPFGGIFPNPSVVSAAVAMITQRIQICAGSIVLPLHHPVRVAEEWSVVDNLSKGRVALSIASGWHANDFALAPDNYSQRKEIMHRNAEIIQQLWRGETVTIPNQFGESSSLQIFPKPIQSELPMWMTSSGNPESFRMAGELGFNLLTHLSGQDIESLRAKIETYRAARREHGHSPDGCVSLMLHTFVWNDAAAARDMTFEPLLNYLRTYRSLSETAQRRELANGTLRNNGHSKSNGSTDRDHAEVDRMLRDAAQRYYESCGLFGTPDSCLAMVEKLRSIGVDEIACLIDFGIAADSVLASLKFLNELREAANGNRGIRAPRASVAENNGRWRSVAENISRHNVTHLQCTPSLAGSLALSPESLEAMRRLNKLLLGGEALPTDLAKFLRRELPCELLNMYGPTETTVWSAAHHVEQVENPVPIGRPIANTQIHIFDKHLQPLPIGVPGELFIGGEGVARGYLNQPELTSEKFITYSSSSTSETRVYRTGDLARWRADGTIEFLGRLDQQVKLRGHRIELGEIESVLRQHPSVRDCAVLAQKNSPGDERLTAYIIPVAGKTVTAAELRHCLEPKLPDYMIPSAYVMLEKLPLTPNGKLDRKALPLPDISRPDLENAYSAPQSDIERTIAGQWKQLLRVEKVGLHDNFFDLGGHSLLVVQAQAKLRTALGVDVPIVRLFQYPTVSALADFLGNGMKHDPLKNIRERGRRQRDTFVGQRRLEVAA